MQEQYDQAIECYRNAIAIIDSLADPSSEMLLPHVQAYNNMGASLASVGRSDEAIRCFERVLAMQPDYPNAHLQLGELLEHRGDLDGSITHFQRAAELFAALPPSEFNRYLGWDRSPVPAGVAAHTRSLRRRASRQDPGRIQCPVARRRDGRCAAAASARVVDLTEQTLRDSPQLVDGDRGPYDSAWCAALLAADPSTGAEADERSRLRELARTWLSRCAERWIADVRAAGQRAQPSRELLRHALQDEDFAGVRGAALDLLPGGERASWRALWSTIEDASGQDHECGRAFSNSWRTRPHCC